MSDTKEPKNNDITEQQDTTSQQRRKAVRNILLGGGAAVTASQTDAGKWAKPVMDSVVLPAHASTTEEMTDSEPVVRLASTNGVYLMYVCGDESELQTSSYYFIVDIGGSIGIPQAGVKVKLVLSWVAAPGYEGSIKMPPMIEIEAVTAANGTFSSTGHDIGAYISQIKVVASLPDYPDAPAAEDVEPIDLTDNKYGYCYSGEE